MALQTFTAGQVLTAAQVTALQADRYNQTVSTKTDSYVLTAADLGTRVVMNKATATTITVNTSLFSAGDTLWIHNIGAGVCTITAGTATVSTSGSLALSQNAGGTLYFTSAGVAIFFPSAAASTQGLTLINTTSFSGVSSQSINNVFSSTYQNYRIVLNAVGTHANPTTAGLDLRLRVGGVDNSANSYDFVYILRNDSAFASSITTNTVTTIAFMGDRRISSVVDVFSPAEAAFTNFVVNQFSKGTANTNGGITSGIHIVATAYDGFTMISGAGTMTGTVSVYGYNK